MKRRINGRIYDTQTAQLINHYRDPHDPHDDQYYEESLYQKRTGEYFLYGSGNADSKYAKFSYGLSNNLQPGKIILPLTKKQAVHWAEVHMTVSQYIRWFGYPEV